MSCLAVRPARCCRPAGATTATTGTIWRSRSRGLSGHGRADGPTGWGASVYLEVMDPAAFGGAARFLQQSSFIPAACRNNPPARGVGAMRLPGAQALARKRHALAAGVGLHPGIMLALDPWAEKLEVALPAQVA